MRKAVCKFFLKLAIYICILLVPVGAINILYQHTNYYQSINETYWLKNYPDEIELMNLGNSHEMYGLNYTQFYSGVSHNFATSSQPFQYDYYIFRNIEKSVADNAVVIVPISYFDWYYNYRKLFKNSTYNTRYYSVLPPWYIYNYNIDEDIKYHWLSVLTAKENLKYIFHDSSLPSLENMNTNCITSDDIERYSINRADSFINHVMAPKEERENALTYNEYFFEKLLSYLLKKEYRPVVMISPVTECLTTTLGTEEIAEFDRITNKIMKRHPDILFLDYSRDKRFSKNLGYFQDSDHMNFMGANAFTECLLRDLVDHGLLEKEKLVKN